jgi:DnaJ like chaperone protein
MSSFTKWLFAGLGWAIGGPIGAILGYYIGKSISPDKSGAAQIPGHKGPYRNTGTQQDIDAALMVLIAVVMKADGEVRRSELDYVKRFLLKNYGEARGKEMLQLLKQIVHQDIPVDQVCAQIKVNTDYSTRYHMVDFLFGLGGADGEYHHSELGILRQIAQYLGISQSDYTSIQERHVGSRQASSSTRTQGDPYKILGITKDATDDEVKRAYRRMAMKYHPDRVAGMSEELQRNAAEQMKEINEAYERIKQQRPTLK